MLVVGNVGIPNALFVVRFGKKIGGLSAHKSIICLCVAQEKFPGLLPKYFGLVHQSYYFHDFTSSNAVSCMEHTIADDERAT